MPKFDNQNYVGFSFKAAYKLNGAAVTGSHVVLKSPTVKEAAKLLLEFADGVEDFSPEPIRFVVVVDNRYQTDTVILGSALMALLKAV